MTAFDVALTCGKGTVLTCGKGAGSRGSDTTWQERAISCRTAAAGKGCGICGATMGWLWSPGGRFRNTTVEVMRTPAAIQARLFAIVLLFMIAPLQQYGLNPVSRASAPAARPVRAGSALFVRRD